MGGYRIYLVVLRHLLNLLPTHIDAESFSNKVFKDDEQIKIPKVLNTLQKSYSNPNYYFFKIPVGIILYYVYNLKMTGKNYNFGGKP